MGRVLSTSIALSRLEKSVNRGAGQLRRLHGPESVLRKPKFLLWLVPVRRPRQGERLFEDWKRSCGRASQDYSGANADRAWARNPNCNRHCVTRARGPRLVSPLVLRHPIFRALLVTPTRLKFQEA